MVDPADWHQNQNTSGKYLYYSNPIVSWDDRRTISQLKELRCSIHLKTGCELLTRSSPFSTTCGTIILRNGECFTRICRTKQDMCRDSYGRVLEKHPPRKPAHGKQTLTDKSCSHSWNHTNRPMGFDIFKTMCYCKDLKDSSGDPWISGLQIAGIRIAKMQLSILTWFAKCQQLFGQRKHGVFLWFQLRSLFNRPKK